MYTHVHKYFSSIDLKSLEQCRQAASGFCYLKASRQLLGHFKAVRFIVCLKLIVG